MFAAFARYIHFQEYWHHLGGLFAALIKFLGKMQAVDRVQHIEERHRIAAFVGL